MPDLTGLLVRPEQSIREVIASIDRNSEGIALIADEELHLIGTVTDGDVRRAILVGTDLNSPVQTLLDRRVSTRYAEPVTAPIGTSDAELLQLMNDRSIRHVPLLDGKKRVVDVALISNLAKEYEQPLRAVVMAGGAGTRLRPLTEDLAKPMVPMGDRPLLELIIGQLRDAGIRRVNITTHYRPESISRHFGDGRDFGVEINYVQEDRPLGTAGGLSLLQASDEPLFVVNGDILTKVDFRAMLDFHREHEAQMTVAVKQHEQQLPFGVVEIDGVEITGIVEKPVVSQFINAGMYLLNPEICRLVPDGEPSDMPALINRLLAEGHRVISFPVHEYWLDVGRHADYQQARDDLRSGRA